MPCDLHHSHRIEEGDPPGPGEPRKGYDEETALQEAGRCLANSPCDACDLCRYFCPELCITRNPESGRIEIDYDYCKGCGICAFICPKGAITMELEA
jgi:2-oxoacid:acceptor oxidoreductase delta subunit (pyruvate/2-ketoisovalerate family)